MGVDQGVVDWLAARRPGTATVLVDPIRGKRDLRRMRAHRRAIAALAPDVFQASLPALYTCEYALAMATTLPRVGVVAIEQLPLATDASVARRRLKRWVSRRLAAHIAVGYRAARFVEDEVGLRDGSVRTVHNGVPDIDESSQARVASGPVVGTLARLDPIKGIDLLLEALAGLPGVTAAIVGQGPSEVELRALADDLGVADRARFLGWSEHPRGWLGGFDLFVLPSRMEGLPLSIAEAMLARLPVVATAVGSVDEIVLDGETGILIPPDDVDALRVALARLLEDPVERQELGNRGRERALRDFTSGAMARAYEAVYAEITGRPMSSW